MFSFSIAGLRVDLQLPFEADIRAFMPSFAPFLHAFPAGSEAMLTLNVLRSPFSLDLSGLKPSVSSENDIGNALLYELPEGHVIAIRNISTPEVYHLLLSPGFKTATAWIPGWDDPAAGIMIDSMLRIAFSQAAVACRTLLVHASAIVHTGEACLFMGRSGTGKSTHSANWLRTIPDTFLLNDDNPALRLMPDGTVMAYGTPWSGKTPCYKPLGAPVRALGRIVRDSANSVEPLSDIAAFVAVLPGVSLIRCAADLHDDMCSLLQQIVGATRVCNIRCRPDAASAAVACAALYDA